MYEKHQNQTDELPALRPYMDATAGRSPHLSEVQESLLGPATEGSRKEGLNIFIIRSRR